MPLLFLRRDTGAEKNLPEYYDILGDKRTARYLLAKRTPVPAGLEGTDEDLMTRHEEALQEMGKLSTSIDDYDSIRVPKPSLLDLKLELARRYFKNCNYCERMCGVDRTKKAGVCGVMDSRLSSEFLHFGEEPELVPSYTFFFAGCTFKCVFCQNWDISQNPDSGIKVAPSKIARMIERRTGTARNTNWVGGDPTSNLKFILEVLYELNSNIAQVWNSNMYVTESTMALLDGIIDVYLTDFKYGPGDCGKRLSKVDRYWDVVTRNHRLANEQTENIIRHLVLPNHVDCCTRPILKWIAENLDTSRVRVNVMDQYHPDYNAYDHDDLTRKLKLNEYAAAVAYAKELNLSLTD